MSKVTIKVDYAGVGQLLKGDEVREMLESIGSAKASSAGTGYEHRTHKSEQRYICNVYASSREARQDNSANNTLLRSLG